MLVAILLALLAAPPGTIRVRVDGAAREVVAYKDGLAVARAPVAGGAALVEGLDPGAYDLRAEGDRTASDVVHGVRAVADGAKGFDVTLTARRAHRVDLKTELGARVWTSGLSLAPPLLLPEGMHRIVVDHPAYVSSAERWVRVAGPTTIEVPLDPGLEISGVVTGPQGPVAGAAVEVLADGLPTRRATTTDAQGNFAVAGFRGGVVSLRVSAPGFADRLQRVLFDPFAERARTDMELAPGSAVTLDAPGECILLPEWYEEALEEPRLRANFVPARGPGRFDGLVPGQRYAILAKGPGLRPARTETFEALEAGLTLRLGKIALEPGATLRGRIQGGPGGSTVVSQGPEGTLTCRADRQGRFEFTGLDPGDRILWVQDVDETGTSVTLAARETREIELVCTPPPADRELKGFVFDADSKPLPGVVVEAASRRAVTGEDGAFRLDPLPRGPPRLAVTFVPGPGCRGLVADPHLPFTERKAAPGTEVKVQLERAGTLRIALDPGERTLARATLLAEGATGLKLSRALPSRASGVVIDDLPVGRYVVEIAAPGFVGTGGAVVDVSTAPPPEPPVVKVLPGRTIRGKVVLRTWIERPGAAPSPHDTPAPRGFVALLDGNPLRAPCVAPLDADGTYVLDGVPEGPVLLAAAVPGFPVAVADGGEVAVEEPAEAAVLVTGDGEPVLGAHVRFLTPQGIDMRDVAANGRFRGVVADDEDFGDVLRCFRLDRTPDGRIAAPFLQPGSYRVIVAAEGWEPAQLGVRAFSARARGKIRETVEGVPQDFPSGLKDIASPVKLTREKE
ncbi:MAG TPA: carboxypeptidase regulatory-like domain-containing protein [Planctomycetota bacterium]|nr:carboxypeptidase regulatory-like domain-containing protein [Planctomycetota bacterium]